ncbi:WD repeat-containing protein 44 [Dichanthelium oligosanthes]|uniref:WD repeat-containing protein 44 n=1 Tax=Dichanthelium oligosanthes TaxID=888268 RepID=A0A1E5VS68_9POAL|nr:WD repeat-containing protein 44 [Dichanthelium oligosanthes]
MRGGGGDGDKEAFFHCLDRVPSGLHLDADFPSDDDDDEEEEEVRVSFASAMGDQNMQSFRRYQADVLEEEEDEEQEEAEDPSKYDMWMSDEPMSIQERRRRLHQGLGMASSRDLALRRHSMKKRPADVPRSVSRQLPPPSPAPPTASAANNAPSTAAQAVAAAPAPAKNSITRRRSDSNLVVRDGASVPGKPPSQPLRRVRSLPARHDPRDSAPLEKPQAVASRELPVVPLPAAPADKGRKGDGDGKKGDGESKKGGDGDGKKGGHGSKNQDDEKEAAVVVAATTPKDVSSNTQTGVLGLEEFEKFIGNTPIMKLMRRGTSQHQPAPPAAGVPPKGDKAASKKKGGWLKNIKSVAIGFIQDTNAKPGASTTTAMPKSLSTNASAGAPPPASSSERLKVHQYGKSSKELTGLYMCQEIQAHEGSIWSIKFSADGRRLASAGEDSVVRVWQVVETNAPPSSLALDGKSGPLAPLPPATADGSSTPALAQMSKKSTRGKSGRDALPEHLVIPDKVFALAEQPACVLEGHKDDVLDLTWSKSDQLLSSSMDKTVRLWDTESKACLKTFAHSDYVTCIQFNPVDDRYFISGSLDAKVRIWSIPDRQVVDWTDLNEMVTAASYTPDGQGAIIGSHQGCCRLFKTKGCKLSAEAQIDIQAKKRKAQAKKITGFQFAPGNPAEVLVTSADSQIRVFEGVNMVQKFRGFKNTSSQITAAYTSDGRYAVCASEDSHVYLWRTTRVPLAPAIGIGMKPKTWCTIRSYENFYCKDVSAAVPWTHSPSPPGDGSPSSCSPASRDKQQQQGMSCNEESCSVVVKPEGSELAGAAKPEGGGKGDSGNAWGLVVVTASLGGEIRVYQNFGMPFRIKGQANLFY